MSIDYDQPFNVTITKKEQINHDTIMFGFQSEASISLKPAEHFQILMKDKDNLDINRPYTPILCQDNYFEVPIKIYKTGSLTPILERLPINSILKVQKKMGKIAYSGMGRFVINPKLNNQFKLFSTLLMVCGGTGITPAYSLIRYICDQKEDPTKLFLLYANKTQKDILLKKQLDEFQKNNPNKFVYHNILDQEPSYQGYKGYVTLDVMKEVFPKVVNEDEMLGSHCGPGEMNKLVSKQLKEFGLKDVVKF